MIKKLIIGLLILMIGLPTVLSAGHNLVATTAQINEAKANINENVAPYIDWYNAVKAKADSNCGLDKLECAKVAKAAAFVYAIKGNTSYGDKARDLLKTLGDKTYTSHHWHTEGTMYYGQAFDLLNGANYNSWGTHCVLSLPVVGCVSYESYKQKADDDLTWDVDVLEEDSLMFATYGANGAEAIVNKGNNIGLRRYAAAAVAGSALDHISIDSYKTQITDKAFNNMITSEGGWTEGAHYNNFAAIMYVPYLIALKNSGINAFTDAITKNADYGVKIRMPDDSHGNRPNIEDSAVTSFPTVLFDSQPNAAIYNWDFFNNDANIAITYYSDLLPELITNYDDSSGQSAPNENGYSWTPTQFLPEAGIAVFRDNWNKEQTYLLMQAEHNQSRIWGVGHEHVDPLNIIISKNNQLLITDSGYKGYSEGGPLMKIDAHNTIMIDNNADNPQVPDCSIAQGTYDWLTTPSCTDRGVDVYLQKQFTNTNIDYAEAKTAYAGANITRSILFPQHEYFIMVDDINSGAPHTYTDMIHGLGTFAAIPNGGKYTNPTASVKVHFSNTTGDLTTGTTDQILSPYWNNEAIKRLNAIKTTSNTRFLSVIYPYTGSTEPTTIDLTKAQLGNDNDAQGIKINDKDYAMTQEDNSIVNIDNLVSTDAKISFTHTTNPTLDYTTNFESKIYNFSGKAVYESTTPIDQIVLEINGNNWNGMIKKSGSYSVNFYTEKQVTVIGATSYSYAYPWATLTFNGDANFTIVLGDLMGIDNDSDGLDDAIDQCDTNGTTNIPTTTDCATWTFNAITGCHVMTPQPSTKLVNTIRETDANGNNKTYCMPPFPLNSTVNGTNKRIVYNVNRTYCDGLGNVNQTPKSGLENVMYCATPMMCVPGQTTCQEPIDEESTVPELSGKNIIGISAITIAMIAVAKLIFVR